MRLGARAMKWFATLALVACGAKPIPPPPPPLRPTVVEEPGVPKRPPLAEPAYLAGSLVTIARKYIDTARFDYRRMLAGAVEALELEVPEAITEIANDVVTVRAGAEQRTFAGDVDSLSELGIRLTEIIHFVQTHATTSVEAIELATVNGMLRTLDPHTHVISAAEMREWDLGMAGKFAGIGITIGIRDEAVTAISVFEDAPAVRAGIRVGDKIVAIDGQPTQGLSIEEAIDRLRGEPKTVVKLTVSRDSQTLDMPITRAEITIPIVTSRMLAGGVGYVNIDRFGADTVVELKRAMDKLKARAWVIDLRDNSGGMFVQAVGAVDLFVDRGVIVSTVAGGKKHDITEAKHGGDTRSPVVVLVGPDTASSAEIMAGALAQLDRALLVGQRTFGKGSVQVLADAARGAKLKLTIAEYVAANDISVQAVGITPDLELVPAVIEPDRVRLVPEPPFREIDLHAHLAATVKPPKSPPSISYVGERDHEIEIARRLALVIGPKRKLALRTLPRFIDRARREADAKIVAAFRARQIDWSAGPAGKLAASFDAMVNATAGESVTIHAQVTNTGPRVAHRVIARATSEDPTLDGLEIAFGKIEPGRTVRASAAVKLPRATASRIAALRWTAGDMTGETMVKIAGVPAPTYAFSAQIVDDGDRIVEAGERVRVRARVTNRGTVRADKTIAALRGAGIAVERARAELVALEPNDSADVELAAVVNADAKLELVIGDQTRTLDLPIGAKLAPPNGLAIDHTPPRLHLADVPLETTAATIRIAGAAEDEQVVGDVYVVTSNRAAKLAARKVFYVANKKPRLPFEAEVPLAQGANRIVVTAREREGVQTVKTVWVYRR